MRARLVAVVAVLLLWPMAGAAQEAGAAEAADRAWLEGDTDQAERLYSAILAADSTHYAALHRMALLRAWADRHDESLALFDRMLSLYPNAVDARVDRARVLAWRGDLDTAVAALESLLDEDPANTTAIGALAQLQSWAGRYDEALRAYTRLEGLDPGPSSASYDRARVLAWASRFEAAGAVYDSILAERPADLEALRGSARVASWSGDLKGAERRWRAALEVEPGDAEALVGLARALRWQGREADGLEAARRAVALSPTSTEAREELRTAELAFAPYGSPVLAHEWDSDGNRIATLSATGRIRPTAPLTLRIDAYARDARERGTADLARTAQGATLTGRLEVGSGWGLSGGVGASASDTDHPVVPAYTVAVSSPAHEPVRGTLAFRRQAFDATARLIERGVTLTLLAADGTLRITDRTRLNAAAGTAWLHGRASGEDNRRWNAYASASHRVLRPLTLAATIRAFGYQRDLNDGYFDPDFFGLAEVLGRLELPLGPVQASVEGAPGFQRVGAESDARPVGRVASSLAWTIAPGRELSVGALFANAGLNRISAAEDADYLYRALTARLAWSF